ncbi:hypothetical protein [Brevibacterium album]|uniref:hypothetical protein n=1 Tax=Brevibacterium album TaxID=417948 RepID=UPI0004004C18|nr:hypothetical protein [Brevibacterium album]
MSRSLTTAILRGASGVTILNAGVDKLGLSESSAAYLQSMAAKGFPALEKLDAEQFGKLLAAAEVAVGATLLAPFIPTRLAGLALGGFSAGMLTMYFRTEEFTKSDRLRPKGEGVAVSHNVWLAAIAAVLIIKGGSPRGR